jgi:hypothetical protein
MKTWRSETAKILSVYPARIFTSLPDLSGRRSGIRRAMPCQAGGQMGIKTKRTYNKNKRFKRFSPLFPPSGGNRGVVFSKGSYRLIS